MIAVRNITWFGLATIVLLPAAIDKLGKYRAPRIPRRKLDLSIAYTMLTLTAIAVIATFAHPSSWFERTYDKRTVATVQRIIAGDPSAKIFADVRFADWLIWHDPSIGGRVAYDTSFELLTAKQLKTLATITEERLPGDADPIGPYSVLVLDPSNKSINRHLLSRRGTRVVLKSKKVLIATKPVA